MTGYVTGWPAPGYWELPEKVGLVRGQRFACMGSGHADSEHQTNFLAIVHASGEVKSPGGTKGRADRKRQESSWDKVSAHTSWISPSNSALVLQWI